MRRPAISIIVPTAPGADPGAALASIRRQAPAGIGVEVLVVSGRQPSRQRNLAAQRARGEFLYFLDHDSRVGAGTIASLWRALRATGAAAAGGPNPGTGGGSRLDRAAELILGSPAGTPLVNARYRARGRSPRAAGERSLILCNLMVRREVFLSVGGFDPRLYPNEENEFLGRLKARGWRALYVPAGSAEKHRRYTVPGFLREAWRYGRGRMEQIWVNPHRDDMAFLGLFGISLAFAAAAALRPVLAWGFAVYAAVMLAEGVRLSALGHAGRPGAARFAALAIGRHLAYLLGMLCGAATGWSKRWLACDGMRVSVRRYELARGRLQERASWAGFLGLPPWGREAGRA